MAKTVAAVSIRLAAGWDEVHEAFDLAARVFGPNYFEAAAAKQFHLAHVEPLPGPSAAVVAVDDGRVVGFIRLVERRLRFGAQRFRVGGITSVSVAQSHRGRHVGVALVRVAMRECRRRGDDLSVLFARRAVDGWYPKFGFVGIGQHVECRTSAAALTANTRPSLRLRRGFLPASAGVYSAAYDSAYRTLPGHFVRPSDWWARLPARMGLRKGMEFLSIVAADRRVVGYVVIEQDRVWEIAIGAGGAEAAARAVAADRIAHGVTDLAFHLHPAHAALKHIYRQNHTLSVRRAWNGGHMAAVLTPGAASRLAPANLGLGRGTAAAGDIRAWPVWSPLDEF